MQRLLNLRQSSRPPETPCPCRGSDRCVLLVSPPASATTSPLPDRRNNVTNRMYRPDEQLQLQTQPVRQTLCGSLRRDTHWKCLLISVLIWGCLTAITWCRVTHVQRKVSTVHDDALTRSSEASPCQDGYIYIPVAFVIMLYLVYLVECWHCHTRVQLQSQVSISKVYDHIHTLHHAAPLVWWKSICYHYVRRTRQVTRYRNGDAFTSTQVYYERVNSNTATCAFNFTNCGVQDVSRKLVSLEEYPATKIHFTKGFSFASLDTEQEFEEQRTMFFQQHERQDDYMETREGMDLLNTTFRDYMVAFAERSRLPWYLSHVAFWLTSACLLSWPLRVLIEFKTAYVHIHVHKLFGSNYVDSSGGMTRVSTMGSSELRSTSNYTIVPSYSEALLMDCASAISQVASNNMTSRTSIPIISIPESMAVNGHGPMRTMIVSNGQVQNGNGLHSESTSAGGRAMAFLRRLGLGGSSDSLHPKPNKRKKGRRRRNSLTEPTTRLRHSDSDGLASYNTQRPTRAPHHLSQSSLLDMHPGAYQMRPVHQLPPPPPPPPPPPCTHASQYCHHPTPPPQRRPHDAVLYDQGREQVYLAEQPPCYEEAVGLRAPYRSLALAQACCSADTASITTSNMENSSTVELMETSL